MDRSPAASEFDRNVPVVVVKVGRYPVHHGSLGAIRSLGRVGVPVYAVVEDPLTPAAVSRYLSGHFVWPTRGTETESALVEGLARIGGQLPRRSVAVPTDDEAAVLLAEHATDLEEWYLIPRVTPRLPRMLTSKRGLFDLCRQYGLPTPAASFPVSLDEVESFAARASFPVVVKNVDPWTRLREPAVPGTTIVGTPEELCARARGWPPHMNVMLQEYIPRTRAEDWIFHGYFDRQSTSLVAFTGVKLRSWPPHAGVTTYARTVANAALAEQTAAFCQQLGYHGVVDLDWRFDCQDGKYKLVDFNPRVGAQFRLFQNEAGVDVVRALHLDLTGRQVPTADPVIGRRLIVENLDAAARLAYRSDRGGPWMPSRRVDGVGLELAWTVPDDPVPLPVMVLRFGGSVVCRLIKPLIASLRHRSKRSTNGRRGRRPRSFGPVEPALGPPGRLSLPVRGRGSRGQGGALLQAGDP